MLNRLHSALLKIIAILLQMKKQNKSALVDCTEDSDKMMNFIEGANLEYILLTHGHFDHIGGVKAVKAKTGAKVVISKEDEPNAYLVKVKPCGILRRCAE